MVRFGIQAPHEQINPTDLLNDVIMMERYDIEKCWSSNHYMPWWHTGATGGAAWPWLGAALAKTDRILVGTGVTAPISLQPCSRGAGLCYAWIHVSWQGLSRAWKRRIAKRGASGNYLALKSREVRKIQGSNQAYKTSMDGGLGNL